MLSSTIPKIFKTKNKISNTYSSLDTYEISDKAKTNFNNYVYKPKHFPPFINEWFNGIYTFNKNIVKLLPTLDENTYNLVKSYFNLYVLKFNKNIRAKRLRVRTKKSSTNRLIASRPNLKHTNDKVSITVYTYNRNMKYYVNKLVNTATLDKLDGKVFFTFMKNLKQKNLELKLKIDRGANTFLKKITPENHLSLLKNFSKNYLNSYIIKNMRKEMVSISHRQSILFEQSKYEKQYLTLLISLLERAYNKKVILDIVNLKYFYNSSSIFSNTLITKLKKRKNKPIKILNFSLDTFEIPPVNRMDIYDEMYNRKKFIQNASIENLILNSDKMNNLLSSSYNTFADDALDESLLKLSEDYSAISSTNMEKSMLNTSRANLNDVIKSLKNKYTNGIRIEIAGRLTRRNTAERSVFKLRYKGNIKNTDSSYKGLSAVLFRGHAKSNLVYNQSKSRLRIGAFGLKTWVSSN